MAERKQVGFRASTALYRRLVAENKRSDVPIQKIVEKAVEEYLRKKKRGA
jgi:hypothetical protein